MISASSHELISAVSSVADITTRCRSGRLVFSLRAANGCLLYEHAALRFLFVRVPPVLSPRVRARVSPGPEGWHVDVRVEWHGHLICWYGGRMRPSQEAA